MAKTFSKVDREHSRHITGGDAVIPCTSAPVLCR